MCWDRGYVVIGRSQKMFEAVRKPQMEKLGADPDRFVMCLPGGEVLPWPDVFVEPYGVRGAWCQMDSILDVRECWRCHYMRN